MDRVSIRRLLANHEKALFRTAFCAAFVGCLFLVCLALQGLRMNDIFRVTVPRLNVRDEPGLTARAYDLLEKGNHVSYRGEQVEQDGHPWARIAFLRCPPGAVIQEWQEGWVAMQDVQGDPFLEKETCLLRKMFLASNRLKWRAARRINATVQDSPLPGFLKRAVFFHPDKALHMAFMAVLGCAAFCFFLAATGVSAFPALLASLLVTNALGLVNEGLDLLTGKGAFELRDLAANVLGSATTLLPFSLWVAARRISGSRGEPGTR